MAGYLDFFRRQVVLVHVSGVPVRADYSWFLVVGVMSVVTAASINSLVDYFALSLVLGLAVTGLFFVSIFLHEFAHAVAAKMEKLEVVEIVLHPFGGLTRFRHEPETPRAEFRIAVAGPAASFIIAVVFVLLMAAANASGLDILAILLFLLGLLNFLIAVFNMLPGYPLDGGRVLRAHLWRSGKDLNQATVLTGRCGQVIGIGLGVLGVFIVVIRGEFFTGFWAMLVGFFLFDSAKGIIGEVRELEQRVVDDVMKLPFALDPETKLQHFIDQILPLHRRTVFPVAKDRQLYGIFVLEDMKATARGDWHKTTVAQTMKPIEPEHFVESGTPLAEARELMRMNGVGAVGVIDREGKLVGFLEGVKGKK
ncbi:MAG: site-2 protease family protein [Pyrinomonadaceae bacterium]